MAKDQTSRGLVRKEDDEWISGALKTGVPALIETLYSG